MHTAVQHKIVLAYSWESVKDAKPIEHWFDLTSISGDPGAHWTFAEDGYVPGIALSAVTRSCAGYKDLRDALSTKQSFITYFMNPNHLCIKFDDKIQTVIGKYKEDTMIVCGRETKTRMPQWECTFSGIWKCTGLMTTEEKTRFIQIISLN